MKLRLLTILILYCSLLNAQTGLVSGELNVTTIPTNNGNGTFTIVGNFSDSKGRYFASDVEANMSVWKGNNYFFIQSASANGSELTLTVEDTYSIGFLPTGIYSIGQETPTLKLPAISTTGDSNPALQTPPDQASKWNYILLLIDSAYTEINNIYNSNGILTSNRNLATDGNDLRITSTGSAGHLILDDSTSFGLGTVLEFQRSGTVVGSMLWNNNTLRMVSGSTNIFGELAPNVLGFVDLTDGSGVQRNSLGQVTLTNANGVDFIQTARADSALFYTVLPTNRPANNSFWQHNADGTGQYIDFDSLGGDGNGIYSGDGTTPDGGTTASTFNGEGPNFLFGVRRPIGIGSFPMDYTGIHDTLLVGTGDTAVVMMGAGISPSFGYLAFDGMPSMRIETLDDTITAELTIQQVDGSVTPILQAYGPGGVGTASGVWARHDGLRLVANDNPIFVDGPGAQELFYPTEYPLQNSFWRYNSDGSGQYVDATGIGDNIYNSDGLLTNNRLVDLNGNNLTFVDTVFGSWGGLNLDVVPNQYVELFWNNSGSDYNAFRANGKGLTLLGPNGVEIQTEDFGAATSGDVLTLQSDGTVEYEKATTNRVAYMNFQDYTNDLATSSGSAKIGATSTLSAARGVKGPVFDSFEWTDVANGDATSLTYIGPNTIANGSTIVTIEVTMYVRSIQAAPDGNNTLDLYVYKNGTKAINQGQRRISNVDEGYFEITLRYVDIGAVTNDKYELYWEWAGWNAGNDTFVADGTWTATAK